MLTFTGRAMTTTPDLVGLLDRLAAWNCKLYRVQGPERDPIGRPATIWDISGTEYYLEDYIEPAPEDYVDFNPCNLLHVERALARMDASQFDLTKDALETRLYWRGYHQLYDGWSVNVKLHDVWKYQQMWGFLEDLVDQDTLVSHDWSHVVDREWEYFLDSLDTNLFDPKLFHLSGRSGGWLVYNKTEMALDEAEALYELYESVPEMVDSLCKEIATDSIAYALAELWDEEVEEVGYDYFYIDGVRFSVNYERTK